MTTLQLLFPTGRYHATPWGRHPNEGEVEWPPCPWRLLRALVAVWHRRAAAEIDANTLGALIEALASTLPVYRLPRATFSHTRHYMPEVDHRPHTGKANTTLTFDAFIQVPSDLPLCVTWPHLDLAPPLRAALALLAERLTFLGRAESWVDARLLDAPPDAPPDAIPALGDEPTPQGWESVELLAPLDAPTWARRREALIALRVEEALATERRRRLERGQDPDGARLPHDDLQAIHAALPPHLLGALHAEPAELRQQGWTLPPGARRLTWVRRPRQSDPLPLRTRHPAHARAAAPPSPAAARFVLTSAAPLRLTTGLLVAEKLHRHLIRVSDGHPTFSGHSPDGHPLTDHGHAHILLESWGRPDGGITHLTLYAADGFDEHARDALHALPLRTLYDLSGVHLALIGIGPPGEFAGFNGAAGQCPLLASSTTWISHTPFVPTLFPKTTRAGAPKLDPDNGLQRGSPEHDLRRLLALNHPHASLLTLEALPHATLAGHAVPWHHFRTQRTQGQGQRGPSVGHGYRLTFDRPLTGPLSLGYAAHFGLGSFIAGPPPP